MIHTFTRRLKSLIPTLQRPDPAVQARTEIFFAHLHEQFAGVMHRLINLACSGKSKVEPERPSPEILADANVMIANGYMQSGRYGEAIEALNNALRHDPQFAKAYFLLGMARSCRGEHALAIGHYSQAISLRPEKTNYYFCRARAFDAMRQPRHAYDDYGRVLMLEPQHEGARARWRELQQLLEFSSAPLPLETTTAH